MLAAYLITLIVGGVFVGLSVMSGLGKDVEADHGEPGHIHFDGHDGSLAEAAHAGHTRKLWLPFMSFRFWTFGAFFFGLTGLALTELAGVVEPAAALMAGGAGLVGGAAASALVRMLRRPVGDVGDASRWVGVVTELLHPLAPTGLSKVRVRAGEKDRDLIVRLADRTQGALPKGTRVLILEIDADGRGRVTPEAAVLSRTDEEAES